MAVNEMQGPDPVRSLDAWVTVGEIARSLHCSNPSTVTNWRKRYANFPEPVAGGSRPRFRWGSVLDWVLTYRRDWIEEHAPYLLESGHSRLVTAIKLGLSVGGDLPDPPSGTPGVRFAVAAAAILIAVDPDAADLDDPYHALALDLPEEIHHAVEDQLGEVEVPELCDEIRDAFESASHGNDFHDPPAVVDLFDAVVVLDEEVTVCDVMSLGCGTGRALTTVARRLRDNGIEVRPQGYEIDPALASGASSLLRAEGFDSVVEQRNLLADPPDLDGTSDCVVVLASPSLERGDAQDPTGGPAGGAGPDDRRWFVARRGAHDSASTWVQVALSIARSATERSGGSSTAAVLVPMQWLGGRGRTAQAGRVLREWLISEHLLRAVVVAPVAQVSQGFAFAGLLVVSGRREESPIVVVDPSHGGIQPSPKGPVFPGVSPSVFEQWSVPEGVRRFVVDPDVLASEAAGNADLHPAALHALARDDDLVGEAPFLAPLARLGVAPDSDPTSPSLHEAVERVGESIELLAEELARPRHRLDRFGRNCLEEVRQRFEQLERVVRAQSDRESRDQGSSEPG